MKTFKKLVTILLLFLSISCTDNSEEFESTELTLSETYNELNLEDLKILTPLHLNGEFKVWQTDNDEIVVYSKSEQAKNFFILQGADKTYKEEISAKKIKELIFLDHIFILITKDGEQLYLSVKKDEEKKIKKELLSKKIKMSKSYEGYGVVHVKIPNNKELSNKVSLNNIEESNSIFDYLTNLFEQEKNSARPPGIEFESNGGGGGDNGCQTGGKGSSSCSVSASIYGNVSASCTTSCQTGYYACCNQILLAVSCKCHKN